MKRAAAVLLLLLAIGVSSFAMVLKLDNDRANKLQAQQDTAQDADADQDQSRDADDDKSQDAKDDDDATDDPYALQANKGEGDEAEATDEEYERDDALLESLKQEQEGKYYYSLLDEENKTLYVEVLDAIQKLGTNVRISAKDEDVLNQVFVSIYNDHPEIFYIQNYHYTYYTRNNQIQYMDFSGDYLYDRAEIDRRKEKIEATADAFLSCVPDSATDYDKVKKVYEYLVWNTEYSYDSPDNQNICSVFLEHKSVCSGYARAAMYLLERLGVDCIVVSGMAGEAHSWNIINADGNYYQCDVTWADPIIDGSDENMRLNGAPDINYSYLLINDALMGKDHEPDDDFKVPACDSLEDNYFVKEGRYMDALDEAMLKNELQRATDSSDTAAWMFSDEALYKQVKKMFENSDICNYMPESIRYEKYAYRYSDERYTLELWH